MFFFLFTSRCLVLGHGPGRGPGLKLVPVLSPLVLGLRRKMVWGFTRRISMNKLLKSLEVTPHRSKTHPYTGLLSRRSEVNPAGIVGTKCLQHISVKWIQKKINLKKRLKIQRSQQQLKKKLSVSASILVTKKKILQTSTVLILSMNGIQHNQWKPNVGATETVNTNATEYLLKHAFCKKSRHQNSI